jgi:hypothetical protein
LFRTWVATASSTTVTQMVDLVDDELHHTHPFALAQNEGLELENIAAGSATANVIDVFVDFSWAEVPSF